MHYSDCWLTGLNTAVMSIYVFVRISTYTATPYRRINIMSRPKEVIFNQRFKANLLIYKALADIL